MLSIIIPFFNEEKNLTILQQELTKVLNSLGQEYEIILVNDGSTDTSQKEAQILARKNNKTKLLNVRKRSGKGEALSVGTKEAKGDLIIFMDADLQDDPKDLPKFLAKIRAGYDLVNGRRIKRQGNFLIRSYSSLANWFLRVVLKSPFSDINCPFKVMKTNVLNEVVLYSNHFRFLPLGVFLKGFKVTEIPINNRVRRYGKSKYGIGKIFIGFFDTLTAYFLYKFSERPLHFFGLFGGILFLIGFVITLYLGVERLFFGVLLYRRTILFLGLGLIIVGIQVITTGIIGELVVYLNKKK